MNWRALLYLVLVGPLHHLAMVAATLPAALLLPPDIVLQLIFALPVFCALLYWAVPALMRGLGVLDLAQDTRRHRFVIILAALLITIAFFSTVVAGITRPAEATVLNLVAVLCTHTWLIRTHLRT